MKTSQKQLDELTKRVSMLMAEKSQLETRNRWADQVLGVILQVLQQGFHQRSTDTQPPAGGRACVLPAAEHATALRESQPLCSMVHDTFDVSSWKQRLAACRILEEVVTLNMTHEQMLHCNTVSLQARQIGLPHACDMTQQAGAGRS